MEEKNIANGSYSNGIFSNDSNSNASLYPEIMTPASPKSAVFAFPFSLTSSIISCVIIAVACTSVFVNSLLLWAIKRVDNSELKARRFIINMTISNMAMPVMFALDPYFISAIIYMSGNIVSPGICLLGIYASIGSVIIYSHAACVLGLAGDRIYAVARPLIYSTVGYPKPVRLCFLFLPWICGVIIWSVFVFLTWSNLPPSGIPGIPTFCLHLLNAYLLAEGSKTIDSFLATANVVSFFIYISIFIILQYKERIMQNLSMTTARKTTLSLARTYFLTNVTTLALYLPAPIFSILTESATGDNLSAESANIASALLILHLLNTCLDPLILMSRIPSIRKRLPIRYRPKKGQNEKTTQNESVPATVTQKTDLKTDSALSG